MAKLGHQEYFAVSMVRVVLHRLKNFPPAGELEALKSLTEDVVDNRLYHQVSHPDHIAMVRN